MLKNNYLGFSLIELMVVVAIVSLLASVALPAYSQYILKARVASAIEIIKPVITYLKENYATTGAYPNSIVIGDLNKTAGTWQNIDNTTTFGDVGSMAYIISADGLGTEVMVTLKGLTGIPDYVEPVQGAETRVTGAHQAVAFGIRDIDGIIYYACGSATVAGQSSAIPFDYLPQECNCIAVANFIETGTCS